MALVRRSKRWGGIHPMSRATQRSIESLLGVKIVINPNVSQKPLRPYDTKQHRVINIIESDAYSRIEFAGYPVKINGEWISSVQYEDERHLLDILAFILMCDFDVFGHQMLEEIKFNPAARVFMLDYISSFDQAQHIVAMAANQSNEHQIERETQIIESEQKLLLILDQYIGRLFVIAIQQIKKKKSLIGVSMLVKCGQKLFCPNVIIETALMRYCQQYRLKVSQNKTRYIFDATKGYLFRKKIIGNGDVIWTDTESAGRTVVDFSKQDIISITYNKKQQELCLQSFYIKKRHALSTSN